jgi:hypothetical protein
MVEFHKALIPSDSVGWCKFLRKRVDATPESLFGGREHPKSRICCESARLNQHVDVKRRSQSHAELIFAKLRRCYFWRAEGSGGDFASPAALFSQARTHTLAALFFQRVRDATTDPRPQLHQQLFSATFIFVCCYKQR